MAYESMNEGEGLFGSFFNRVRGGGGKKTKDLNTHEIALTRKNHIYRARSEQMAINQLSLSGGRAYVAERLSRFAGESRIDWEGGERADGVRVTGRKQQSHVFPYPARIANKINQYVFSDVPKREGIDEAVQSDISTDGKSLNDLMAEANSYLTTCGWCWIGVDAPTVDGQISQIEKSANKIRPYWQVYSPLSVVDWKFDEIGNLVWLITETEEVESVDLSLPEKCYRIRRIWTAGEVRTVLMTEDAQGKMIVDSDETVSISYGGVPFVLVGTISAKGHPFDDIESINRTIMDLESVNRANFFKRCYPQLVLPVSCIQNTADAYNTRGPEAADLIIGLNYPILVSPDDKDPSVLMPSSSDMGAIRAELQELKHNMFESVGLMLQAETRQVASAESKAWDFLDVAQVMTARAEILETAERKAMQITVDWDSSISPWESVYNRDFDIGDFNQEMQALILSVNASMPPEMYRIVLRKILDRIDRVGASLSPEQREEVQKAIDEFSPNALTIGPIEELGAQEP